MRQPTDPVVSPDGGNSAVAMLADFGRWLAGLIDRRKTAPVSADYFADEAIQPGECLVEVPRGVMCLDLDTIPPMPPVRVRAESRVAGRRCRERMRIRSGVLR